MRPELKSNFIIVLNDNKMSISENVGGMSKSSECDSADGRGISGPEEQVWTDISRATAGSGERDRAIRSEDKKRYQTAYCSGNVL